MTDLIREDRELSIGELDAVSGGSMLDMAIAAYEKYLQGVGQRLMDAVHPPKPTMSLHMR
ncbi:hypothetical protein CQ14_21970 [Bradyrhizobium lablabi]|uniref:Uncharacterized protein n=1 Tax=Bradyrhizobium lablabi TaxID=722472 RepID=A0A0R3MMI5_9BRAD|nr:hypothetical protein [Bradyrhizobium lablabi]KRR21137.1 hypothetical protein CQ14_21970 [Bradyrhizobium lablabi]